MTTAGTGHGLLLSTTPKTDCYRTCRRYARDHVNQLKQIIPLTGIADLPNLPGATPHTQMIVPAPDEFVQQLQARTCVVSIAPAASMKMVPVRVYRLTSRTGYGLNTMELNRANPPRSRSLETHLLLSGQIVRRLRRLRVAVQSASLFHICASHIKHFLKIILAIIHRTSSTCNVFRLYQADPCGSIAPHNGQ